MRKLDRKGRRSRWEVSRASESLYNTKLRQLAKQIKQIIAGFHPEVSISSVPALVKMLNDYALTIEPWAQSVASFMVADVTRRNEAVWKKTANEMGQLLQSEIRYAPTGGVYQRLMAENVDLITSLPREAASRVHRVVTEGLSTSMRASEIAAHILETGDVTESRAKLIARTEVSRAASTLTQSRAQSIGSQGYIWRTSKDSDVRPTHQKMEGVYVPWTDPPKTDKGLAPYHAGCGPNCRCFPEPVIPNDLL